METKIDIEEINNAVAAVCPSFDINKVYLFGSCATGKQKSTSDIDLCLETGETFSLISAALFTNKMKALTGKNIDVVTERSLFPHVKNSMQKTKVLLYER